MTKHFDDMWLALDNELTSFDTYLSDKDWMSTNNSSSSASPLPSSSQDINTPNLSPQSYDNLLQTLSAPDPSFNELHSKSRSERIEAVKQFYNKMPTIINASSLARLHTVASRLYKSGKVKAANSLTACENKLVKQHSQTSVRLDDADFFKELMISQKDDSVRVTLVVQNKATGDSYTKNFDNLLEAAKFLNK